MKNHQNPNQNSRGPQGDDRIVRPSAAAPEDDEVRGSRSQANEEREGEDGTALSMSERKRLLRREWQADLLPQIVDEKGYWHYCWLSTTNPTDPIYRRLKVGYELVKFEDMNQLGVQNQMTSGEFVGCVSINEMILARIPHELYQELMLINHHERPLAEEELLRANAIEKIMDEEDSSGKALGQVIGEGLRKLARPAKTPVF